MPRADAPLRIAALDGAVRREVEAACGSPGVLAQHHPVWLDVLRGAGETTAGVAAYRGDRLCGWMLASWRDGGAGTVVTSLPLVAYGGPVLLADDPPVAAALLRWFVDGAGAAAPSAVGLGLSPFAAPGEAEAAVEAMAGGRSYRFDNFAQVQPLTPHPLQQVAKKRRDTLASLLRRAVRAGVRVSRCDDADTFRAWLDVYRARYAEIGARPLPDAFHLAAFELGRAAGVVEFWAAHQGDRFLGGSLLLVGSEVVDYFSSAYHMDDEARALAPNNLLLSEAFTALAARGRRWFNWQSSPGREGVYRYKAGWGAEERPQLYVGRLGPDGARLCAATRAQLSTDYAGRFVVPFSWLDGAGGAPPEEKGDA